LSGDFLSGDLLSARRLQGTVSGHWIMYQLTASPFNDPISSIYFSLAIKKTAFFTSSSEEVKQI
jgi:MFS-type transporter involved in bile tolerance (Atg22 family)